MDVRLPDGEVITNVPDGMSQVDLLGHLQRAKHPSATALMRFMAGEEATRDTSGTGKFFAGMGKSVSDIGLGVRQLTGNATQAEVDEIKQRDAALMNSGAGMAGNIAGNVGMAVVPGLGVAGTGTALGMKGVQAAGRYGLASPLTLGGAATQGTLGATQAALQPVGTGESRAINTGLGFLGGAAVPVAGMALKGGHSLVEPFYQGGRNRIVGRAINEATGENAPQVMQRLQGARELVPGSSPTAAEVGESGGLAAVQRAAGAIDAEAFATRAAQQDEARVAALHALTGTGATREAAEQARNTSAGALYRAAREAGIDQEMAAALKPQIQNLMERMPSGVLERAKELARLNGEAMGKTGSVSGLHWIKLGVDDLIKNAKPGTPMASALTQYKKDLLSTLEDLSPLYEQGRQTFQNLSKPVNQMDVAQEIANKSIDPMSGRIKAQAYARALSDDTAAKATGFNKATLAGTMEPDQLGTLEAIKQDLARSVQARDLGRGAGSDTVQKLSAGNVARQTGLPRALLNLPGVGWASNFAYEGTDDAMRKVLAKALLDPKETAKLMASATPGEKAKMLSLILRSSAPAVGGSVPALLDAAQ